MNYEPLYYARDLQGFIFLYIFLEKILKTSVGINVVWLESEVFSVLLLRPHQIPLGPENVPEAAVCLGGVHSPGRRVDHQQAGVIERAREPSAVPMTDEAAAARPASSRRVGHTPFGPLEGPKGRCH